MTAVLYTLQRHHDVTGISGAGAVGTVIEFDNGDTVLHWDTDTPSTVVYRDVRHIEALHGHSGATTLELLEPHRLVKAYQQLCFWLTREMTPERLPLSVGPHPVWPDRLLVMLRPTSLSFWVALLDGSTAACTHEEVRGELVTTWVSPDGGLWLQCAEDGTFEDLLAGERYDEDPLETFDREDR